MEFGPFKHHRRSIRLPRYDYAQAGAYFVTVCTHNRECLLGEIVNGEMILSEYGKIVREEWERSAQIRQEIALDSFVIMPNHFHGIVIIREEVGAHGRAPLPGTPFNRPTKSLGTFIAGFKSAVTTRINEMRDTQGTKVWQRNYHEHIVRNERELSAIREYIANNPANWLNDTENPS